MAGEAALAQTLVDDAVQAADADNTMCPDAMAHAILGKVLATLSASRSRRDLDNYIEFELDNLVDSDMVVTRGC